MAFTDYSKEELIQRANALGTAIESEDIETMRAEFFRQTTGTGEVDIFKMALIGLYNNLMSDLSELL